MLIEQIGEITPDNIVDAKLESETKWSAVRRFVECVIRISNSTSKAKKYFSRIALIIPGF